jgi:4a-hydroxytetrahydrobiopterin dehydratase
MATLSRQDVQRRLEELHGWTLEGTVIRKVFTFDGFPQAVAFVSGLVPGAESADHHPDIAINYRRVTLVFTTHSEGGVTEKDFDGARMADRLAGVAG